MAFRPSQREIPSPKEAFFVKKLIALGMAALMSLALLAGCSSADPNNPYGQEPAPANSETQEDNAEEETSAVPFVWQA